MNETLEHYKGLEPLFKAQMDPANRPKFLQEQQTDHKKTTQERYEHAADLLFASVVSSVVAKNTAIDPFYYFPGLTIDQHTFKQSPIGSAIGSGITFSQFLHPISWVEILNEFKDFGGQPLDFFKVLNRLMVHNPPKLWALMWSAVLEGTFLGLYQYHNKKKGERAKNANF